MNKIIKLTSLLFLMLIAASCNKDPEFYTLETPADQMLLQASSTEMTLEKEKEKEVAVTFTWNAAAQRGEGVSYFFRMYMSDLHSNVTSLYEIAEGETSISFTHSELNDILAFWNILPGDQTTIEAEVIAQVSSSTKYMKPELSKTQFEVTGYDKNATAIYMVMVDNAGERTLRRMTEKVIGSGIYQSSMDLKACKYFFTLSPEADYPSYMKGANGDNSLQYATEGGTYEMLENTKVGTYTVVVDLNMLDVSIVRLYTLPKEGIWIVGNSCDVDWDIDRARTKGAFENKDPRHPELWTYTGNFYYRNGANEFKLSLDLDWGGRFFFAPQQGADPATEHALGEGRYEGAGGDLKWTVRADGKYTLKVDLNEMKIYLVPAQ